MGHVRRLLPLVAVFVLAVTVAPIVGSADTAGTSAPPTGTPAAGTPTPASGDALDQQLTDALAQQAQLDAARQSLEAEVKAAHDEQSNLASLITANRNAIVDTEKHIDSEQRALTDASHRAQVAHAEADGARRQANADRDLLAATLRSQYMSGQDGMLKYVVESTSFSDLMTRIAQASQLTQSVEDLSARLRDEQRRATDAEATAIADEAEARQAAADLQTQARTLQDEVAKEQTLIARLTSQAGAAMREISQIDGQTAAVAQQVADLRITQLDKTIADAEQATWDEASYYMQQHLSGLPQLPGAAQLAQAADALKSAHGSIPASLLAAATRLIWPAPGTAIVQRFGPSPYTFEPPAFGIAHFHTGIDLSGPMGTPVYAAAAGVVVSASPGATGYGNHVVIAIDGHMLTLYGHLEAMLVHSGDQVKPGQLIALMGSTGNSTGPHLHFEVRIDNVPVDPTPLLPPLPDGATGPPPLPKP